MLLITFVKHNEITRYSSVHISGSSPGKYRLKFLDSTFSDGHELKT